MSSPSKKFLPYKDFLAAQEKRVSSAAVLVENTDGQLLVVKATYKPYWSLPGGIIDAGETPREAAIRELHEEVGIVAKKNQLDFVTIINRRSKMADTYQFVFRLLKKLETDTPMRFVDGEIEAIDWVSKNDVISKSRGSYNLSIKNWANESPRSYLEHMVQ